MNTLEISKTEFYCESLIEQLNNTWKVDGIESGHAYHELEMEKGKNT